MCEGLDKGFYSINPFGSNILMLDVEWEWIKTSWLKSWLDEIVDAKVPEIDHTSVVCPHEK